MIPIRRNAEMTKENIIEWLVYNMDCINCPVYKECADAKPKSCKAFLTSMLRASDDATLRVVEQQVFKIRHTQKQLFKTQNENRRKRLLNHLAKLWHDMIEIRKHIGKASD